MFGFILYMADSKCDINSLWDLQCLFLVSLLAMALLCLYSSQCLWSLFEDTS